MVPSGIRPRAQPTSRYRNHYDVLVSTGIAKQNKRIERSQEG